LGGNFVCQLGPQLFDCRTHFIRNGVYTLDIEHLFMQALQISRRHDLAADYTGLIYAARRHQTKLCGAAASWPLAAPAQQQAMPMIGFINAAHLKLSDSGHAAGSNTSRARDRHARVGYPSLRPVSWLQAELFQPRASIIVARCG